MADCDPSPTQITSTLMSTELGPPAKGQRRRWTDVPEPIRLWVEQMLGGRVVRSRDQEHGFSPGIAALLTAESGTEIFVKAVGPDLNPVSPTLHRQEASVVKQLPVGVPAPRLLESWIDPDSGWVALAFEAIHGRHPQLPWEKQELGRVLAALEELFAALTPAPIALNTASEKFATHIHGWKRIRDEAKMSLDHLGDWSRRHLDLLVDWESAAPAAVDGNTLLHFDLRADNILLTGSRVYFVDWPHACVGAAWVDLLGMAPSVAMQGGPGPEELLQNCASYRTAAPEAITAAVASLAGYFIYGSLLPPPPGLPTLRAFQAAQGEVALLWLADRLALP